MYINLYQAEDKEQFRRRFLFKLKKVLLRYNFNIKKFLENIKHTQEKTNDTIIQIRVSHIHIKPPVLKKCTANQERVENI